MTIPPAVRWVPDGPHAGLYIRLPVIEQWQWTEKRHGGGVTNSVVPEPPPGAIELVPISAIEHAIDFYRDSLRAEDRADGVPHAVARRTALRGLADGAIYQPVDPPKESNLTMADLRRAYDC